MVFRRKRSIIQRMISSSRAVHSPVSQLSEEEQDNTAFRLRSPEVYKLTWFAVLLLDVLFVLWTWKYKSADAFAVFNAQLDANAMTTSTILFGYSFLRRLKNAQWAVIWQRLTDSKLWIDCWNNGDLNCLKHFCSSSAAQNDDRVGILTKLSEKCSHLYRW